MGVYHAPETPYGKEQWKWDHTVGEVNPFDPEIRGMRPISFQEFPKAMYKAGRNDINKIDLLERRLVGNRDEQARCEAEGFSEGPAAAVAKADALEREIATLAANRAAQDRTLSPQAQAEADAYEQTVDGHVAVIPETPKTRRPGRPRKAALAAEG